LGFGFGFGFGFFTAGHLAVDNEKKRMSAFQIICM